MKATLNPQTPLQPYAGSPFEALVELKKLDRRLFQQEITEAEYTSLALPFRQRLADRLHEVNR